MMNQRDEVMRGSVEKYLRGAIPLAGKNVQKYQAIEPEHYSIYSPTMVYEVNCMEISRIDGESEG